MSVDVPIEVPILPCPWCDITSKLVEHKADYDVSAYYVECEGCGCHGPWADEGEDAVEFWNKRAVK